jgi:hypothetical protein
VDRAGSTRQTGRVDKGRRSTWKVRLQGQLPAGRGPRWAGRRLTAGIAIAAAVGIVGSVMTLGQTPGARPSASNGLGPGGSPGAGGSAPPPPPPGHEVYGFVPYWEMDGTIADHLRATATTTVALFSVTNTAKGAIDAGQKGYRAIAGGVGRRIIADAHALGRRVDVTWTSFGQPRNSRLFGSIAIQDTVIASLVALRADLGIDGIAVDVEGIAATDIPAYGAFVGRLRTALVTADAGATVTATAGAGPAGAALALAATLAGADRIFLMGYDYRTATSDPGGSAPLSRGDGVDRSIVWSLELYAAAGVPVGRTLLGLPLYGLSWPAASAVPGAPTLGKGDIWIPRRNLASLLVPGATSSFDPVEDVAFLAVPDGKKFQAVYYDTPESLRPKLGLANELGLAGGGFWALGYERGLPGYTELIDAFRAGRSMAVDAAGPAPTGSEVPANP